MEIIHSFRDLRIWALGIAIVKETYCLTNKFPRKELFGLASQMQRASASIPSNIAEGHIRAHTKEFLQFLRIALGSCAEPETQAMVAKELGYISEDRLREFIVMLDNEAKQIRALTKKLNTAPPANP
jgi:four helix bundle protein